MINGTYNSVQTLYKNYVVYIQGKINFTLFGTPIDTNFPLMYITNAQIHNEATTNVFVNNILKN